MKQGWENKRLEDCFKLKSGDGLTSKMMSRDGVYPVFGGNGIAGLHDKFNLSGSNVIIGRVGALCGNVRHMNEKLWLTDNAFRIVDFKYDFDHSFLTYLLNFKNLREYARQAAQPVISNSSLKDVILKFPKSLTEQQGIVAMLDEVFTSIAKAQTNAEQNLKNTKELFESYLQGVFENKGEGWEEKRLGEVCEKICRGISPKYLEKNGVVVLNQKCIRDHKINFDPSRRHDDTEKKVSSEKFIRGGDVLVNSTGEGTLGRVAQVRELSSDKITVDSHVSIVRPTQGKFHLDFFGYAMIFIEKEIAKSGAGASGQTELARTVLENNFTITFPNSLSQQKEYVKKLDALSAQSRKLVSIYQQKINDLEELKKSILQKAFNGELKTAKALAV